MLFVFSTLLFFLPPFLIPFFSFLVFSPLRYNNVFMCVCREIMCWHVAQLDMFTSDIDQYDDNYEVEKNFPMMNNSFSLSRSLSLFCLKQSPRECASSFPFQCTCRGISRCLKLTASGCRKHSLFINKYTLSHFFHSLNFQFLDFGDGERKRAREQEKRRRKRKNVNIEFCLFLLLSPSMSK